VRLSEFGYSCTQSCVPWPVGCQLRVKVLLSINLDDLGSTAVNDGGLDLVLNLTRAGTGGLKLLDDVQALAVGNLTEDNVLAIEPRGDDGGDEELRAVAASQKIRQFRIMLESESCSRTTTYVLGPALAIESRPGLV
jgi:hypothetical protein